MQIMTELQSLGLATAVGRYYPNWLQSKSEGEQEDLIALWADELGPLGDFATVWEHILTFMRESGSNWAPDVLTVRKYVVQKISDQRRRDRLLLEKPVEEFTDEDHARSVQVMRECFGKVTKAWEERDRNAATEDKEEAAKMATTTKLICQRMAKLEALDDRERRLDEREAALDAREGKE